MANKKVIKKTDKNIPKSTTMKKWTAKHKVKRIQITKAQLLDENVRLRSRLHENNQGMISWQNKCSQLAEKISELESQRENRKYETNRTEQRLRSIIDSYQDIVDESLRLKG